MKDKVVIITGGSSGIGKALAFEVGSMGAKVVITGRDHVRLFETKSELEKAGIVCLAIVSDVSIESDNENVINTTIRNFGKIDVLINNAGITMRAMFEDADIDATIRKVMEINFFGAMYITQQAIPYLKVTKGSIVGISSIAGFRGLPVRSGYSASKFALNGFLEALRTELLSYNVHVLTACPGFTSSNIRYSALDSHGNLSGETVRNESTMMSAEECATEIVKAIEKRKRTLILTPVGKLTVWLNKLFPRLTDYLVYKELAKEKDSPLKKDLESYS